MEFVDYDPKRLRAPQFLKSKKDGQFVKGKKGEKRRPAFQYETIDETIRVVHGWGGKFRDERLNELSHEEVVEKTHVRFKDIKKELVAGTRTWSSLPDFMMENEVEESVDVVNAGIFVSAAAEEGDGDPDKDATDGHATTVSTYNNGRVGLSSGSEAFENRSGGFTSVRKVVSSVRELQELKRRNRIERRKNFKKNLKKGAL